MPLVSGGGGLDGAPLMGTTQRERNQFKMDIRGSHSGAENALVRDPEVLGSSPELAPRPPQL